MNTIHFQSCRTGKPRRGGRAGGLLLELVIATSVLGAALLLAAQSTVLLGVQQRRAWHRFVATQEAANALERARVLSSEPLNEQRLASLQLSPAARNQLPQGQLQVTIQPVQETNLGPFPVPLQAKVSWNDGPAARLFVVLTDWHWNRTDPKEEAAKEEEDASSRAPESERPDTRREELDS